MDVAGKLAVTMPAWSRRSARKAEANGSFMKGTIVAGQAAWLARSVE